MAARNFDVKPEDFLLASLQEKLAKLDADFIYAMRYVLWRFSLMKMGIAVKSKVSWRNKKGVVVKAKISCCNKGKVSR